MPEARTMVGMASMPERIQILEKAVASLRPQVDAIRVYLNNFEVRPNFLSEEEGVLSHDAEGDLGDAGKFYWLGKDSCDYYLTADDDLLYPPDYVQRLTEEYDKRSGKAIIGVHGFVFSEPIESYVSSRNEKYKCTYGLESPQSVHIAGTGTANFGSNPFNLSLKDFPRRNLADLQLGIAAQNRRIPLVVIPRLENWIQELQSSEPESGYSIWKETKQDNGLNLGLIASKAVDQWTKFPDPYSF